MATSINVRLSDELEEKLKNTVEEVKKKTPIGAEVNNSTIVRGAIEEFISNKEREKQEIVKLELATKNLKINELESAVKLIEKISKAFENEEMTEVEKKILLGIKFLGLEIKGKKIEKEYK